MKYLIFDTETTGLPGNSLLPLNKQPYIVEFFGHIIDENGEVLDEVDTLIRPPISIPQEVIRIHGINDIKVQKEPTFKVVAPQIQNLIEGADAMVAHNLPFDMKMLGFEFRRLEMFEEIVWPPRNICTVEQSMYIKGHRLNLGKLHEELFGSSFVGAHRARQDVEALTRCFLELLRRDAI